MFSFLYGAGAGGSGSGGGITPLSPAAKLATTGNLVGTYNNGTMGVGATITLTATGTLNIDSVITALNDNILVKDQTTQAQDGVYVVTTAGATGVHAVLTRRSDFNSAANIKQNVLINVTAGTVNGNTAWYESAPGPFIVGTTAIVFTEYSVGVSSVTTNTPTSLIISPTTGHVVIDPAQGIATTDSPTFNFLQTSVTNGISAAGTTRADATALTTETNIVTTVASGTGVVLSAGTLGGKEVVINRGANPLKIYAPGSGTLNGVSGTTGVTLPSNAGYTFYYAAANTWDYSNVTGTVQSVTSPLGGFVNNTDPANPSINAGSIALQNSNNVNITGGLITATSADLRILAELDIRSLSFGTGGPYNDGLSYIYRTNIQGISVPCLVATTGNLDASYDNGPNNDGIGATLTNTGAPGHLIVDGVDVSDLGFLNVFPILVWQQTDPAQNGFYTEYAYGSGPWYLTRARSFASSDDFSNQNGALIEIMQGDTYTNNTFVMDYNPLPTIGTTPITFTHVNDGTLGVTTATGTANQVLINGDTSTHRGPLTFTLPQDIATTSSPTFAFALQSALTGIAAAGTDQASATALTDSINTITSVAPGTGVKLPPAVKGKEVSIYNFGGGEDLQIYSAGSETLNGIPGDFGITLPETESWIFKATSTSTWVLQSISSMGYQSKYGVQILGGNIDGTTIGNTDRAYAQFYTPINNQTGTTYTIAASDAGKEITFSNASPVTVTLPKQATTATVAGFWFKFINKGAGIVTFVVESGDSIIGLAVIPQYGMGEVIRDTTTQWAVNLSGGSSSGVASVDSTFSGFVDNGDPANPVIDYVQPDWNETDPAAVGYIQNKPITLSDPYWLAPVRLLATTDIIGTYSNGTAGVGATLTGFFTGTLTIDGKTIAADDSVLLLQPSAKYVGGIYTVTNPGGTGVNPVLTRRTDYDNAAKIITGTTVLITDGDDHIGQQWWMNQVSPLTIGSDDIVFTTETINGLGTMSTQNSDNVNITGGSITGIISGYDLGVVQATSTTDLDATYANGSSGVGATLTANSNGVLIVDNYTVNLDEYILAAAQTNEYENGIFKCTDAGSVSTPFILERASYYDTSAKILQGTKVFTINGSNYKNANFYLSTANPITVGSTDLIFFPDFINLQTPFDLGVVKAVSRSSNLTANYNNGTSGQGATLTSTTNATLTLDGQSIVNGDYVGIFSQTSQLQNGIYVSVQTGASGGGGSPWILQRASYFDSSSQMRAGAKIIALTGTLYARVPFYLDADVATVGTSTITFQTINDPSLGTMAQQNADSVAIIGGSIDGTDIGIGTPGYLQYYKERNAQTGTTYTLALSDDARAVTFNNASNVTVTLPQQSTTTTPAGYFTDVYNLGAGTVIFVKEGSETLNGRVTLQQNESCRIYRNTTTTWSTNFSNSAFPIYDLGSVKAVTTGTNLTSTYSNGSSGRGATLTSTTNTTLTLDGQAITAGDIVGIFDQSTIAQNGIYLSTQTGSGSLPWILTRAKYFDSPATMKAGCQIVALTGNLYGQTPFYLSADVATVGTSGVIFATYTAQGIGSMAYQDSTSVDITGGVIDGTVIGSVTRANAQFYTPINAQTGTTYAVLASDCGKTITFNNSGAITVTLPQQSTTTTSNGFFFNYEVLGAGAVTFVLEGADTSQGYLLAQQGASGKVTRNTSTNWVLAGGTATRKGSMIFPDVGTIANTTGYYINLRAPYGFTIDSASQVAGSLGTAGTYTVKISGTNVTGLTTIANATSITTTSATGANVVSAGDSISFIVESTVAAVNYYIQVNYTYYLNV